MARTAAETATILSDLYDENFANDSVEPFRISWPQLRSLAAVPRLDDSYLKEVNIALSESGPCLIPFDDFFLIARPQDVAHFRKVPGRVLEQYLPDAEEHGGDEHEGKDADESEDIDI